MPSLILVLSLGTLKYCFKKKSALAPKCQVYNLLCAWDFEKNINSFIIWFLQADINTKYSQLADLRENIKSQQEESSKAKDELTSTLASMEKLKEDFKNDRANWDAEKATLVKRAEDAETTLKPVTEELTGLKWQINAMTSTVFGK